MDDMCNSLRHDYINEESIDYSEDYSLDWNKFSFEYEIDKRAKIHKENLQGFKLLAASAFDVNVNDESVTKELQKSNDGYSKLLKNGTNTITKYEALMKEYKDIKQNVENLTANNKFIEETIIELKEEEKKSHKEYQQQRIALQKGIEMYSTNFNINITTKALSDNTYEATLKFGEKEETGPIKFIVDRTNRKVIDFQVNEVLLPEEEEDIRNKFDKLDNLPGLLCALREIILKK